MTCRCTSHFLVSFIQTIAEVKIRLIKSGTRAYTNSQNHPNSISGLRLVLSAQHRNNRAYFSSYRTTLVKESKNEQGNLKGLIVDSFSKLEDDANNAIAEYLPENIDQLSAELVNDNNLFGQTLQDKPELRVNMKVKENFQDENLEKTSLLDQIQNLDLIRQNTALDSNSSKDGKILKGLSETHSPSTRLPNEEEFRPILREPWMIEKERIKAKYPNGYRPLKKLSPDAMDGIRALHSQLPDHFTTSRLAQEFKVSPEAIRRILKSKWRPNTEEALDREKRWFKRGEQIWSRWAELGATPPKKYRRIGIGKKSPPSSIYRPDPLPELITTPTRSGLRNHQSSESNSKGNGIL